MSTTDLDRRRARRVVPTFAVLLGVVVGGLLISNDRWGEGLGFLAVMVAYAGILVVLSPRSEAAALLRGGAEDERGDVIGERSLAATGGVLVVVVVSGFLVELVRDGPYLGVFSTLAAISGLTTIVATIWLRRTT